MKKIIIVFLFFLNACFSLSFAGGGMAHMFVAEESIKLLPDKDLQQLLRQNKEAYLVGAYYPDSGYIEGTHHGEDSHWDPFIYAFTDYIREKYPNPAVQNPKIVAFLLGCAAHRISDEVMHWTFYNQMAVMDFDGDKDKAHQYGDVGIDLLLNIDKNQWFTHPVRWWVPVQDLVEVYHRMGFNYSADEIVHGNTVLYLAGIGERTISLPAYPFLQWKMPWTAANYYASPEGGLLADERQVAEYQMSIWKRLRFGIETPAIPLNHAKIQNLALVHNNNAVHALAKEALDKNIVLVDSETLNDGSIELQPPVFKQAAQFTSMINAFIKRFTNS